MKLLEFYKQAEIEVIKKGYQKEIDFVEKRTFEQQSAYTFYWEYVYVVCNSGMKNQVAEKIFSDYKKIGISAIKHPLKSKAFIKLELNFKDWFDKLQRKNTDEEKLVYLESLPHIGKITKFHLARNLGIDCAKPDRHLVRIADHFGYSDVQEMCKKLSEDTGDRIGTVDVVLWRYCNINPNYLEEK